MNIHDINMMAGEMEQAYTKKGNTMDKAVAQVKEAIPDADTDMLRGMWLAIDAYVDMNT